MKKVLVTRKNGKESAQTFETQELAQIWIDSQVANNYWGLPQRQIWEDESHDVADVIATESIEISPEHQEQVFETDEGGAMILDEQGNAIPILDGEGNPTYETIAAVFKNKLTLKAEYVIETVTLPEGYDYVEKRSQSYPPMADFLDAQVKINSGYETLIAEGQTQLAKYYSDCLAVKALYPKPE